METLKPLSDFFKAIEKDCRISVTHIGIYAALLQFRADSGFINPIQAYRYEIIDIAKLSSPKTYHKCMRELSEYGYIRYEPTRKRNHRSIIYFSM
jgi:SOS-response transcriptional repressor LexA